MKHTSILFLLLFLFCSAFGQKANKQLKDTATLRFYYVLSKSLSKTDKPYRSDTMVLDIGKKVSRFFNPTRFSRDSAMSELFLNKQNNIMGVEVLKDEDVASLSSMPGTVSLGSNEGESYQIIKNKSDGEINVYDFGNKPSVKLHYIDNIDKQSWVMTNDTASIGSYVCQKATKIFRGRTYSAWFTTEIPVSDGPWKFSGLPGLILKVADEDRIFSFQLIGVIQLQAPLPFHVDTSDYYTVTRAQYQKQLIEKGLGMNINFTNGILKIGHLNGKYSPVLMEVE